MSEKGIFTGEITPDSVVAYARLASRKIVEEGLADPTELEFHYPPIDHKGSKAAYILEQPVGKVKEHMLYVPVMAPYGSTTTHFHEPPIIEKYKPITGQLFVNGQPVPQEGIAILPGEVHQATTEDEGSLTIIFMENGATKSAEERHKPITSKSKPGERSIPQ